MLIVIDANPLISILIKPGKPLDLFFSYCLSIAAPELLFQELERNKGTIQKKTTLSNKELEQFFDITKQIIKIIPETEFVHLRARAKDVCPDKKDVIYFALALHLNCPLWSNEKRLKRQDTVKVFSTHELIALLEG